MENYEKNFNNRRPQRPKRKFYPKDVGLKVTVRDGNVDANESFEKESQEGKSNSRNKR